MSSTLPIVTVELAKRLEGAEHLGLVQRLEAMMQDEKRHDQAVLKRFGDGTALINLENSWPFMNKVIGLTDADVHLLPEIVDHYAAYGVPCRVKTNPAYATPELLAALRQHGFVAEDFSTTTLYGVATEAIPPVSQGVSVRKMEGDEFDLFGELYVRAMNLPAERAQSVAHNQRLIASHADYHYYFASVDGEDAGVAMMFLHDRMGSFCAAATCQEHRGRGLQQALLSARMQDAARLGCDLVVAQAAFASTSQRNMLRCGMQIAFSDLVFIKQG